ncbi:uncharacterized protein LOC143533696 [Bidens hawaiensis]|uniref:uncharacterized protein LOC143533696 n=1 Tax=Bidens hawaiensis TaxID=980011 RepID=UPI00404B09A0
MGHQWVKNENRLSTEYVNGVKEFLNVAQRTLNFAGLTLCPCTNCLNSRMQNIGVIATHLINTGIDTTYTQWVYHGEDEVNEEDVGPDDFGNEESPDLRAGLEDAISHPLFNIGPTNDLTGNQQSVNENKFYEKLQEAPSNPLYEGCKNSSTLAFVVKLMNLKVMNKWTDSSFELTLKLLHKVLPAGNNCPDSYYDVRMLLCEAGLGYELIDVCQYDCAIFYGDNKDAIICPVCQSSRYVRNKIAYKKLRYFPVTPRLKRLYTLRHTAKDMRWHKEVRKDEHGVLRHPADGRAWKHFDKLYPKFADDPRSVRLGLASDGFNPFSNMTTTHSMWPVILMPYNMPSWCTMHKSNYLLSLLIPGPKSPSKDFDVFLRPLVDELKVLWRDGVGAYDLYSKSNFTMYAALWANWWRKNLDFNGKQEKIQPPRQFTGDDILQQLADIPGRTTGKAPSNKERKWTLNDPVKSKDTTKACLDLEDLNIRSEQWLKERNGKVEKPHADFTLTKDECVQFCKFIKSVRLPDGYASNISRCVMDHNTLGGMKTHDCHILLQKILPVGILPFLNKEIRATLIEFCQFFQKICSKTLYAKELEDMKTGIVIILCKLEKIFPPAFFTIMVHLCVHLPK